MNCWSHRPRSPRTSHSIDKPLFLGGSRGLMDRALDLKPEVTQGCGFESRLWQEVSTTEVRPLGKAPNPQLLPGRCTVGCPLLQVCTLGWVKCREQISILIILYIIVYVTNKAHLSLICKYSFVDGLACLFLRSDPRLNLKKISGGGLTFGPPNIYRPLHGIRHREI